MYTSFSPKICRQDYPDIPRIAPQRKNIVLKIQYFNFLTFVCFQ